MELTVRIEITTSTRHTNITEYVGPTIGFISDLRYRGMDMTVDISIEKFQFIGMYRIVG